MILELIGFKYLYFHDDNDDDDDDSNTDNVELQLYAINNSIKT